MSRIQVTSMQEAMLIESETLASTNILQWIWRIPAVVNYLEFRDALVQTVESHKVLSSQFEEVDGAFVQNFDGSGINVNHQIIQLDDGFDEYLQAFLSADRRKGFQVTGASLIRCCFFSLPNTSCCVFTFHASLVDNEGFTLLIDELISRLKNEAKFHSSELGFNDFLDAYQNSPEEGGCAYWSKLLNDSPESALPKLPLKVSDVVTDGLTAQVEVQLEDVNLVHLREFASKNNLSIECIAKAAWAILLHRYCDMDSVVFGSSGQFRQAFNQDFSQVIGSFINTVPIRVNFNDELTVIGLLDALESQRLHRLTSPHEPLLSVLQYGGADGSLLSTGLNFEYTKWERVLESHGEPWSKSHLSDIYQSSFDLACNIRIGSTVKIILDYRVDRFDKSGASQILQHYYRILTNLLIDPQHKVSYVPMLGECDFSLLHSQSGCSLSEGEFLPVHEQIYQVASVRADAIAVKEGVEWLSFDGLIRRSEALAARLVAKGVGVESIVAVLLPRSIDFVVAVMAIMRSGAAYLPVDPNEPRKRLLSIFTDAKVSTVISRDGIDLPAVSYSLEVLYIDETLVNSSNTQNVKPFYPSCKPNHAAYVIFTSGTTGSPKGVVVEHGSLSNHCQSMSSILEVNDRDTALQFASTIFDVHVEELFTTLCSGACLVIRSRESSETARDFFKFVRDNQITILNLPSAFWSTLVGEAEFGDIGWPECVKTLIVGGESVSSVVYSKFRRQSGERIQFLNGYGPTETTVTSTTYKVPKVFASLTEETEKLSRNTLPIGKPLNGNYHFVLDQHRRMVAPGVVGDLYIGGKGVARGYINNAELTEERFILLPNIKGAEGYLYSTGDKVFSDGEDLFFVGRADHQVKVRGFRIELGEVEAALKASKYVRNAIVDVDPARPGVLVAFIESRRSSSRLLNIVKKELKELLPEHMIPADLECFENFPLTKAGKIDKKALWDKLSEKKLGGIDGVHRQLSETQDKLVTLWKSFLGDVHIDLNDSFFDLGGHSLLAVKLFSKIERDFNCSVPLREFFQSPTIENLECLIDGQSQTNLPPSQDAGFSIGNLHPLQKNGEGCPVYCICGIDLYQELANELGENQPVYGIFLPVEERMLQSFREVHNEFSLPTAREMASDYVKVIRRNQPFGPYKLAGISFGGILAYEIAQQLIEDGETVETLILIDSFVPCKRRVFTLQRVQRLWERIKLKGIGQVAGVFKLFGDTYQSRKDKKNLVKKITQLDDSDFELYRHIVYRQSALDYATKMRPYSGDVILVRAIDGSGEAEGVSSPDHGWGRYVQGDIRCIDVPGDHIGVLRQPNVKVMADEVRSDVQKSDYRATYQEHE